MLGFKLMNCYQDFQLPFKTRKINSRERRGTKPMPILISQSGARALACKNWVNQGKIHLITSTECNGTTPYVHVKCNFMACETQRHFVLLSHFYSQSSHLCLKSGAGCQCPICQHPYIFSRTIPRNPDKFP